MKLALTGRVLLAFIALQFFMQEAHELAHISMGRLLCGCWGPREFSVWQLCADCAAQQPWTLAATLAGPLFSVSMMWVGYTLLGSRRPVAQRGLSFALVFANLPMGRLFGVLMGGNDEGYFLKQFMPHAVAWPWCW